MTFLSASEDFQLRTLAALEGPLDRLAYLARLRGENGEYQHWGMTRTYGPAAAGEAMSAVHTQVWLQVLRTPIPELVHQLTEMKAQDRAVVIEELRKCRRLCHPADLSGGTVRHFNSILLALERLFPSKASTPPGA